MKNIYINQVSSFLPNKPVGNEEMENYIGLIGGKPSRVRSIVLRQNGIKTRYYGLDKQHKMTHSNAQLAKEAAEGLFADKTIPENVTLLACATSTPDQLLPSHASMVHGELGNFPMEIFSSAGVCLTSLQALKICYSNILAGLHKKAVCVASELTSPALVSKFYDPEYEATHENPDKDPYMAFEKDFMRFMLSDGAGAVLVQDHPEGNTPLRIEWIEMTSYANELPTCMFMASELQADGRLKSWKEFTPDEIKERGVLVGKQDIRHLKKFAIKYWVNHIETVLAKHNVKPEEINCVIPHLSSMLFYDKLKDRAPEYPQYKSNPISVGEDLAFNNLPEAVDLYIKDNDEDTGKEPNLTTKEFWKSPDIWVRNQKDGIQEHENPYYSDDHIACLVYVRVHNRGKEDFNGVGKWIHVYWAQASTGLTIKAWKGRELYENHISGDHIRAVPIPYIPAGEDREVSITWGIQEDMVHYQSDNGTEKHHYCLIARILDSPYDDSYDPKKIYFDVLGSNDIAQKNISIVSRRELSKGISVFVRNIYGNSHKYSLEIRTPTEKDKLLFTKANVKMKMAKPIYKAWERGGLQATDIVYNPTASPYSVKLNSSSSKLENICMNGAEFEKVTMNFDFHTSSTDSNEKYTFDLIQKDETGNIVGGETFIVESPLHSHQGIEITPIDLGDGRYKLSTDWQETDRILWTDAVGSDVGTGNNITVTPTLTNNKFSAIAISSQGEMAQETITLESKTGFKSISPTPVEDFIDIELCSPVKSGNAVLRVNSLTQAGSILLSKHIPLDAKKIQLNATSLPSGIYVLTYFVDNQIVDSRKFSKK